MRIPLGDEQDCKRTATPAIFRPIISCHGIIEEQWDETRSDMILRHRRERTASDEQEGNKLKILR